MAEEKKEREVKGDNPLSHLYSRDIQGSLGSFIDCNFITDNSKNCRPGFVANKYVNKATGKVFDCTWHCLLKCSAKSLLPLFRDCPTIMRTTVGAFRVTEIIIAFSTDAKESKSEYIFVSNQPDFDDEKLPEMTWNKYNAWRSLRTDTYTLENIIMPLPDRLRQNYRVTAQELCEDDIPHLEKSDHVYLIVKVKAVFCNPYASPNNILFVDFDVPYVRPSSDWKFYRTSRKLIAKLTIKLK